MLKSEIRTNGLKTDLYIDGRKTAAVAYTTYFEERSRAEYFAKAGYRIFFINVSFSVEPINPNTKFSPYRVGVFDDPECENYTEFEGEVRRLLKVCPDAIIFPRIYITMPKWWLSAHPCDVILTDAGDPREAMYSDNFRRDASSLLARMIAHIKEADYAHRIGGWMITGSSTQEWIYRNNKGDLGEPALEPFKKWVKENYGDDVTSLPTHDDFLYNGDPRQHNENAIRYSLFCNLEMAKTADIFAEVVKKKTNYEQVVGTFYGYTFEPQSSLFGLFGLRAIIDSPNLDYFSSPNSYYKERPFGIDWSDMIPVDSLKRHGKFCFMECDIRTYLTKAIQKCRPGEYPDGIYTTTGKSVWVGPPTPELSVNALRKCFAHQLTKGSALWWFDMWGGWYDDPMMMGELEAMRKIYEEDLGNNTAEPSARVVFFADEQGCSETRTASPHFEGVRETRCAMGLTGVPFDSCMVEDAEKVLPEYDAAVFPFAIASDASKRAMELCDMLGVPYIRATIDHYALTVEELRQFYQGCGVHLYSEIGNVVYLGQGYIGLHSANGGEKTLLLPDEYRVSVIFGADYKPQRTFRISFVLSENGTALFRLTR